MAVISKVRTRLREVTASLLAKKAPNEGITSIEVVNSIIDEYARNLSPEQKDILRCGLMVLAGRVPVTNRIAPTQGDLFREKGFPEFVDLRLEDDGRVSTQRFDARRVPSSVVARHKPNLRKNSASSKRDKLIAAAIRQVEAGRGDEPVDASSVD